MLDLVVLMPALLLTSERLSRRHVVVLHDHVLFLTSALFNTLAELIIARGTSLNAGFASGEQFLSVSRVPVCRLRREIDQAVGAGVGRQVVESGAGEEYRLALQLEDVALDGGIDELVRLGVLSAHQLTQLKALVRVMPDRWESTRAMTVRRKKTPRPPEADQRMVG
jgi:hypothetical protein